MDNELSRVETELEVSSYIQKVNYALDHDSQITVQIERRVDERRDNRYTNKFTFADLFPDESPTDAIKHELRTLKVSEYIETVKDIRFPKRSEMRVFGRLYPEKGDVYIKIRVELMGENGKHDTYVMSFHYAEESFDKDTFPYREKRGD